MNLNSLPVSGLIFAWLFNSDGEGREVVLSGQEQLSLSATDSVWLHLNYANTQVQSWLKSSEHLPEDIVEILQDDVGRVRQKTFCRVDDAHLIFFNDFLKEFNQKNSEEIVTMWIICINNVFITLRPHPVEAPDILKRSLISGKLKIKSVGDVYRHWMSDDNFQEISEFSEKLSVLIQDLDHLYERAKVLQDEQAAHVAQFNANSLQVLSTMTVIFLPMTLITGIMGMNMSDLLGLESSFYEVMFLMGLAGASMFAYLKTKKMM